MRVLLQQRGWVQGVRHQPSVPLGTAVDASQTKIEAQGNQPQATDGLPNLISASYSPRRSCKSRPFFVRFFLRIDAYLAREKSTPSHE
jgi:hypothetical protein